MKNQSWKEQKDEICTLIQAISRHYGGDDIEWLRDYAKEVIATHKDDLSVALICFQGLYAQCVYKPVMSFNGKDVLHET